MDLVVECAGDGARPIHHVGDARDAKAEAPARLVEPDNALHGVREQTEAETVRLGEVGQRLRGVRADADEGRACGGDGFKGVTEATSLTRSAGGECLREKVKHCGLVPPKCAQPKRLA